MYRGKAFKQFLIDRYAMGFEPDAIRQEFEALMGLPVSEAEVFTILKGCDSEIRAREEELLNELRSKNVVSALLAIKEELAEVAQLAKAEKDYKTFAQLANSSMKSLEVLISMTEKFKNKEEGKKLVAVQNNYYAIEVLEKDGLIKVVEPAKLRQILGVPDESR